MMPLLSTGPIENQPVYGVRPSQQVTVKISNSDFVNDSIVTITGYYLNGSRTIYVNEILGVSPNEVVTKNYFANLDGFDFVFNIEGLAANQTAVSVWGKTNGKLVSAERLVLSELTNTTE